MLANNLITNQFVEADESTPVDCTFRVSGKLVTIHSDPHVGELGIVVLSASGQAQQFFATSADNPSRIADVVKKFLDVNKTQIQVGTILTVTPLPNTPFVSVTMEHKGDVEGVVYHTHVFGQYPMVESTLQKPKTVISKGVIDDTASHVHIGAGTTTSAAA